MRNFGVLLGLLVAVSAGSAPKVAAPPLQLRIDRILASAPPASWGIRVVDLRTGAIVYSKNEHQPFVPASNAKLFSTAFALTRLGPDYKFRTIVTAPSRPDANGRVVELRLVGGGDPNLSGRKLPYEYKSEPGDGLRHIDQFAQQIVQSGVRTVDGDIIGDDSAYANEPFPEGWAVDDPIYDYGAPVSALFVNDGTFTVRVLPTGAGLTPVVEVNPGLENMILHNRAVSGPTGLLHFARLPGSNEITMTGIASREQEHTFAVDDPPLFAAEALRDALLKHAVQVTGSARVEHSPGGGVPLATHESQPLIEALTIINKESVNLHAEIVLLETGRVRTGVGTRKAAVAELGAFLKEIGIDSTEYTFEDGSGLSRKTLVTPWAVTRLLTFMYASPYRDRWVATLPIGGKDGTLGTRFATASVPRGIRASEIHAKTGSLSYVNALSGYAGDRYAFSILVNNSNVPAARVRRVIDELALALLR